MFYKLLSQNAAIITLIALFATLCLLPMDLSAHHHGDHDNISINGVHAQTSLGITYIHPYVKSGSYANIDNYSGNETVRYYWSDELAVYREGSPIPFDSDEDSDKGSVDPGDWKSFFPDFSIDMTDARDGRRYTAYGYVSLGLKFDFNGDNVWDDGKSVRSSAWLRFTVEKP